jgi:putative restriction endonuclease
MIGFFALTDEDWYQFLLAQSRQGKLEEVNHWAPSGKPGINSVLGAPYFFQLKAPLYRIGGFGFLGPVTSIPISLAWEAFGEGNGAATREMMFESVQKLRKGKVAEGETIHDPWVGCRTILEPVFFPPDVNIPIAKDWPKHTQKFKKLDLSTGEGARIWQACRRHAKSLPLNTDTAAHIGETQSDRFGALQQYQPRLGQGAFRIAVVDAYQRSCAVTGEHSLPVLEAAHIRPYGTGGEHAVSNGLLLRSDVHRLYDQGYVTVSPDHKFKVSPLLREVWNNGTVYYAFEGKTIQLPGEKDQLPDRELLEWHGREVFKK